MKKIIALFSFTLIMSASAQETDLTKKLDDLRVPDDQISPMVTQDKLYLVNKRYSSLVNRHEVSFSGGKNYSAPSHIDNQFTSMLYRYHINSTFQLGLRYNTYYNDLTAAGKQLFEDEKIFPDTDFALKSTSAFFGFNTFYGKMRLSQKSVVYFDQYINLGYGEIDLAKNGLQKIVNVDAGFSFWLGKHMSARLGINNEFYTQRKATGLANVHNTMAYVELGYLFGEGSVQ